MTPDRLAEICREHRIAQDRAAEVGLARAVAVFEAHEGGLSYRRLAAILGVSAPTVVELARRGQRAAAATPFAHPFRGGAGQEGD